MKVPMKEFMGFVKDYSSDKHPHERFGQAFMNVFLKSTVDSELFYTEDTAWAWHIILTKYVNDVAAERQYAETKILQGGAEEGKK